MNRKDFDLLCEAFRKNNPTPIDSGSGFKAVRSFALTLALLALCVWFMTALVKMKDAEIAQVKARVSATELQVPSPCPSPDPFDQFDRYNRFWEIP